MSENETREVPASLDDVFIPVSPLINARKEGI